MKILLGILLGLIFLGGVHISPVLAESPWEISRSHAELQVKNDGKITAVEKIEVDFQEHKATTLTHKIPLKYIHGGDTNFVRIEVQSVQRNLVHEHYQVHHHNDYIAIVIGDERLELSGEQSYQIAYTIEGLLRSGSELDYIVWQGAGGWDAPVKQATVSIDMPVDELKNLSCEVRRADGGVQEGNCEGVALSQGRGRFVVTTSMQPQGSFLVTADFDRGAVPLARVQPTRLADWMTVYRRPLVVLGAISAISLIGAGSLWFARRRFASVSK